MKKRVLAILLTLCCIIGCTFALTACDLLDDVTGFFSGLFNSDEGTYYASDDSYIKLSGGKWTDEEGNSGKYEIKDGVISFMIGDSGMELLSGNIGDGKIEIVSFGRVIETYIKK